MHSGVLWSDASNYCVVILYCHDMPRFIVPRCIGVDSTEPVVCSVPVTYLSAYMGLWGIGMNL